MNKSTIRTIILINIMEEGTYPLENVVKGTALIILAGTDSTNSSSGGATQE